MEDPIDSSSSDSSSESDTYAEGINQQCSLKQFFEEKRKSVLLIRDKRSSKRLSIMRMPLNNVIDTIQEEDERRTAHVDTPIADKERSRNLFACLEA